MNIKEVKDYLNKFPDDANVVFSEAFVIDEDYQGIVDCSPNGIVYDEETKELRFIFNAESFKKCFPKMGITDIPF